MPVESLTNKVTYAGDDVSTVFAYAFKIFANAELTVEKVLIADGMVTTLTLTTDYTVSGAGESTGGNVTLGTALAATYNLVIRRVLPLTQVVDPEDNTGTPAATVEEVYDRIAMIHQQLQEQIDRSILGDPTLSSSWVLPSAVANKFLGWDAAGAAIENKTIELSSSLEKASAGDANIGTNNAKYMTPSTVRTSLPFVDVRTYGAVGDGVADDTAAIQAAIDALAVTGGIVYVPAGSYLISSTLTLTNVGVSLIGMGKNSILTTATTLANGVVELDGIGAPAYRMYAGVKDLTIIKTGADLGVGLQITDSANVICERIVIEGFAIGLKLIGNLISSYNNIMIRNNTRGLDISDGSFSPVNLVQFRDCQIISCDTYAIKAVGGASILFIGCEIEANGTAAQAENVCDFTAMGVTGVTPAVVFDACWFESNIGGADIYFRGTNTTTGIDIKSTSFYSTAVNYNMDINTASVGMLGVGANATVVVVNILFGSDVRGICLGMVIINITNNSSSMIFNNSPSATLEGLGGDFAVEVDYEDYFATSTIVGWAASPTGYIYVKKVGSLVFYYYSITGTSNSASTTFTLPNATAFEVRSFNSAGVDNGAAAVVGRNGVGVGTNICHIAPTLLGAANAWTTSGTKTVEGFGSYIAA